MSAAWTVDVDAVRLDRALTVALDCSRSKARALLDRGSVLVDGRVERDKGLMLRAGQKVQVTEPVEALDQLRGVDAPIVVLGAGENWLAAEKPAGLPVHPLRADEADSLLQRVAFAHPEIEGVGEGGLRSGVVHRLDVDTSGVQLFALDDRAFVRLRTAFSEHRIEKVYRALVHGVPQEQGSVELDLTIVRHRPAFVQAVEAGEGGPDSRRCPLSWTVRERFAVAALVEVRPRTGFLHQIRATFAWLGHPLLGDAVYGDGEGAPRQMLHAARLGFEEIDVEAPEPEDFVQVLAALRG